ncbi:MAG: metal ABC transporter permease [Aquificaceae bacterium]
MSFTGYTNMDLLEYAFLWKGVLSAVFVSSSTSLVGVFLLMRRLSLLGAGLSHAAFGGIALAVVLNMDPTIFTLIYTVLAGVLLEFLIEKKGLPADTVISLFFSFGIALAIMVFGLTQNLGTNVYSYLFGSILTVSNTEFYAVIIIFAITTLFVGFYYRSLMLISFNEEIAALRGVSVKLLNYLLVMLASANIILAIKAVGLILSASFIAIPPMSSLLVTTSFFSTLAISVASSLLATVLGISISLLFDIPPSSTIVMCMIAVFLLFSVWRFLITLRRRFL